MSDADLLAQIEALERRLERRLNVGLAPIAEALHRIETQTVLTNGRVTIIEQWRIETEARTSERALAVKEAANLVAEQAQKALQSRERSRKWWATMVGLSFTAVTISTPVVGSILRHFRLL